MRRKKILDEQAAAAIAAGVPVEAATEELAASQVTEGEESEEEETETETTAEGEESSSEVNDEDAGKHEDDDEDDDDDNKDVAAAMDHFAKQISDMTSEIVDLKVELGSVQTELAQHKATHEGLTKVVAAKIQHATVALGGTPPSMESLLALDANALLTQHAQLDEQLAERFGAGGRVTEEVNDADDPEVDAAAKVTNDALLRMAKI